MTSNTSVHMLDRYNAMLKFSTDLHFQTRLDKAE